MIPALAWLIQDLLQVLATETLLVPDLFLLSLVAVAGRGQATPQSLLWGAFVGGLLWDARWTGLLGFSALLYVAALWFLLEFWNRIPHGGRSAPLLSLFALGLHLFAGLGHFLSWGDLEPVQRLFLNQQILGLPLALFAGWWGCRGETDE
ncbi:MAG: hypothetical protein JMJ93_06745 [Synergistaceae bacterium]|jgi:cell shape-determining protein MreD|nr:hypothetical protein [Synergistaceae bacterium]